MRIILAFQGIELPRNNQELGRGSTCAIPAAQLQALFMAGWRQVMKSKQQPAGVGDSKRVSDTTFDCVIWSDRVAEVWPGGVAYLDEDLRLLSAGTGEARAMHGAEDPAAALTNIFTTGITNRDQVIRFAHYLGEVLLNCPEGRTNYLLLPTPRYNYTGGHYTAVGDDCVGGTIAVGEVTGASAGDAATGTEMNEENSPLPPGSATFSLNVGASVPPNVGAVSILESAYWPPAVSCDYQHLPYLAEDFVAGLRRAGIDQIAQFRSLLKRSPLHVFYQSPQPLLGTDSLLAQIAAKDPQLAHCAQTALHRQLREWNRQTKSQRPELPLLSSAQLDSGRFPGGSAGGGIAALLHSLGAWLQDFPTWWADHCGFNAALHDTGSGHIDGVLNCVELVITNQPRLASWHLVDSPLATLVQLSEEAGACVIGYSYENHCTYPELRDHGIEAWYPVAVGENSNVTGQAENTAFGRAAIEQQWFQAGRRAAQTWCR